MHGQCHLSYSPRSGGQGIFGGGKLQDCWFEALYWSPPVRAAQIRSLERSEGLELPRRRDGQRGTHLQLGYERNHRMSSAVNRNEACPPLPNHRPQAQWNPAGPSLAQPRPVLYLDHSTSLLPSSLPRRNVHDHRITRGVGKTWSSFPPPFSRIALVLNDRASGRCNTHDSEREQRLRFCSGLGSKLAFLPGASMHREHRGSRKARNGRSPCPRGGSTTNSRWRRDDASSVPALTSDDMEPDLVEPPVNTLAEDESPKHPRYS